MYTNLCFGMDWANLFKQIDMSKILLILLKSSKMVLNFKPHYSYNVTICITLFNFFKRCYWFSAIWSFGYLNLKINPLKLYICWEKSLNFIQSNRCKIVLLLAISYRGYRPSEDFAVEQGKIQLWENVTSHTVASTLLQWGFVWSCLCISKLSRSFERGTYSLILIYSYIW